MDDEDVIHIRFNIKRKTASALWDEISIAERLCDFFRQPGRLRYVPPAARRQMEQKLKPLMNGRWALGVGRYSLRFLHSLPLKSTQKLTGSSRNFMMERLIPKRIDP